jgi:hypothetical protein
MQQSREMSELSDKVDYVKLEGQTRNHECHWPKCNRQVPPAMWGCREHWFMLPKYLRNKIWAAYVIGQEKRGDPSDEYMEVMKEVFQWIKERNK